MNQTKTPLRGPQPAAKILAGRDPALGINLSDNEQAANTLWPWPHFSRQEMACRHCGEVYYWPAFMDGLELMRAEIGAPLRVLSGHRCSLHNARIGGAPRSLHLTLAADIALDDHTPHRLFAAAQRAGFTGFGFYSSFLHMDKGPRRQWFGGPKGRALWQI